jgi:hypothetical protein
MQSDGDRVAGVVDLVDVVGWRNAADRTGEALPLADLGQPITVDVCSTALRMRTWG